MAVLAVACVAIAIWYSKAAAQARVDAANERIAAATADVNEWIAGTRRDDPAALERRLTEALANDQATEKADGDLALKRLHLRRQFVEAKKLLDAKQYTEGVAIMETLAADRAAPDQAEARRTALSYTDPRAPSSDSGAPLRGFLGYLNGDAAKVFRLMPLAQLIDHSAETAARLSSLNPKDWNAKSLARFKAVDLLLSPHPGILVKFTHLQNESIYYLMEIRLLIPNPHASPPSTVEVAFPNSIDDQLVFRLENGEPVVHSDAAMYKYDDLVTPPDDHDRLLLRILTALGQTPNPTISFSCTYDEAKHAIDVPLNAQCVELIRTLIALNPESAPTSGRD